MRKENYIFEYEIEAVFNPEGETLKELLEKFIIEQLGEEGA